jgi:hypothetical protein
MVLSVFFPSLMGVGIIASGAILLSDLVLKLLPNRGRRRSHRVAIGAYGVVAAAAAAAGQEVHRSQLLDRVPRRRAGYTLFAALSVSTAAAFASACIAAYRDELGLFHRSPWMIGIAIGSGVVLGALALLLGTLAALGARLPPPLAHLVATTSVGRLQIPKGSLPTIEHIRGGTVP